MPLESASDRAAFLAAFGEPVTLQSGAITGIPDDEYEGVPIGDVEIEDSALAVLCQSVDVASLDKGDTVTLRSTNYVVRRIEPDGTGWSRVVLGL